MESLPNAGSARWGKLATAVLLAYGLLTLVTFTHYGITWDERVQAIYGEYILRWYGSGFADRSALDYLNLHLYGGLFDTLAQGLAHLLPWGLFEERHLLGGMVAVLGAWGTYLLAREIAGERAGALAALALVLTPVYYGHGFNNPKDVPFAALYVLGVLCVARACRTLPEMPWPVVVRVGIAIGLALAIRIGGVLLLVVLAFAALLALARTRQAPAEARPTRRDLGRLALRLGAVGGIAYAVMLPWWPWAQINPLRGPLEALQATGRFQWDGPVLFEGVPIPAPELPWYYVAKWWALTLPEFVLVALAVGVVLAAWWVARRPRRVELSVHGMQVAVVVFAAAFPVVYAAVSGAVVYDGIRHFLFAAPLLAAVTGVIASRLLDDARAHPVPALVLCLMAASLALTAVDMWRLHPYQSIYFNRAIAGGLQAASERYETDYWGNSYKEGAEWVVQHYGSAPDGRRLRVASCSDPLSTSYFLTDRFEYIGSFETEVRGTPDLFLATTRNGCFMAIPGRIVHVVRRQGVPLLIVKQVTESTAHAPPAPTPTGETGT